MTKKGIYNLVLDKYSKASHETRVAIDQNVKKVLKQIQDGTFANEWVSAHEKEGPQAFDKYMKELDARQIEKVAKKLRAIM